MEIVRPYAAATGFGAWCGRKRQGTRISGDLKRYSEVKIDKSALPGTSKRVTAKEVRVYLGAPSVRVRCSDAWLWPSHRRSWPGEESGVPQSVVSRIELKGTNDLTSWLAVARSGATSGIAVIGPRQRP